MLLQGKLCLVGLDFLQMIMGILDGTELRDDLCGSLLSDSGNAGDIVGGIAHKGLHIHKFRWRHQIFLFHIRRIIVLDLGSRPFGLGNADLHLVCGQLTEVPVSGNRWETSRPARSAWPAIVPRRSSAS